MYCRFTYWWVIFARLQADPFGDRFCKVLEQTDTRIHDNMVSVLKDVAWFWHHQTQDQDENIHHFPRDVLFAANNIV